MTDPMPTIMQAAELNPFEAALRKRHNGYDPAAREAMPLLREPETPEQALDELISEELGLAEGAMQGRFDEAQNRAFVFGMLFMLAIAVVFSAIMAVATWLVS